MAHIGLDHKCSDEIIQNRTNQKDGLAMPETAKSSFPFCAISSNAGALGTPLELTDRDFEALRVLIHDKLGIQITVQKRNLVISRLQGQIRQLGLPSFAKYVEYVLSDHSGRALNELANHISTNHTFFFREPEHFDFLKHDVLPALTEKLAKSGMHDLRVWCAGCSSGEEAYTLAMVLLEHFGDARTLWKAGLLATDISAKALAVAKKGLYSEERICQLPILLKSQYFKEIGPQKFEVSVELRSEITFRRLNLICSQFPFRKRFHIIFCRNVMIYFDRPTREGLMNRFASALEPGGYLFIGHSESLGRETRPFKYVRPAVYRREER